ncbi:MAG TPA: tetratricopeptide repeat protein [Chthoniobacterales bacterium]|nr:tetratricopeptide repeat protein [Chthoniobacterales bacterium]
MLTVFLSFSYLVVAAGPSEADRARLKSLQQKIEEVEHAGKYSEGVPIAEEHRELSEKIFGAGDPSTATSLSKLAELYHKKGNYGKARALCEQALKIRKKILGPEHPETAAALATLAEIYESTGNYIQAETLSQRSLQIREKTLGPAHAETAESLTKLAGLYAQKANFEKAKQLAERGLKTREQLFGPERAETAASLQMLADIAQLWGHDAEAKALYERALKIREKVLGPDHPETAESVLGVGLLSGNAGEFAKAEPLYRRALAIFEKTLGPDHSITGVTLSNLALLYVNMGEYAKAEPLADHACKVCEKALGPEHPKTASCLSTQAEVYRAMGKPAKATPICERALKIREKVLGPDHPDTAESVNNRAGLYYEAGDFEHAEPLFKRALQISEKALSPEHLFVTGSLNNLGVLYWMRGEYAKAEPLYLRALDIREKSLGPDDPNVALSLDNLAGLYGDTGEFEKAERLIRRALEIREKTLGHDTPDTGTSVMNVGYFYLQIGDYVKAKPLLERSLEIYAKTLEPEHQLTARALNNLGWLHRSMGDYAKAEPLLQRALKIREKALGPEHPDTAQSLGNLALLYVRIGDYAKAKPLYQRAQEIREKALGPNHPLTAQSLRDQALLLEDAGDYATAESLMQRAFQIDTRVLGQNHETTGIDLDRLAQLKIEQGKLKEAHEFALQAGRAQQKHLSDILSFTSERQRLAFQQTTKPYKLFGTLGSAGDLAETVLREKGVVLDSLLEDRLVAEASGDPKQRAIIEQVHLAKQRMTQLVIEVPSDFSEEARRQRENEKEKLSSQIEQLEANLARYTTGLGRGRRALAVTVEQVKGALPKQATLVELVRYAHYTGKDKEESRYGAIVIGGNREPQWVPLGAVAEIEKNIRLYQKSVRGTTDEATLSGVLRALHDQLWMPIEKVLPNDTKIIIVSPDAELSFVSFATLLAPDDRFLGEKYSIRYVASGRDLLRDAKPTAGSKTTMRVFANPDFGGIAAGPRLEQSNTVALRSVEMRDLQGISLPSLPGTEKEAAKLEARAKKSGWQPQTYLGLNATKAELREVNSPRILHLATHGFFLPEIDVGKTIDPLQSGQEIPKGKLVNPMHRSGLALAGAQQTLQAWAKGEVPPIENDGIVTAEDVGGLKLDSTWLVVLSACDTGGGEARAGEGVMGLRRGFVQAGAQNLLMTLWPISDQTTVQIMLDFYDAAFKSSNAPQALADTQRDWLVKLRKEHGLIDAVRLAGPFIMSSQGKP